jgi:hypothetical protein
MQHASSGKSVRKDPGEIDKPFNGCKVFSATMAPDRDGLGDKVTAWIRDNPHCEVVDTIVTQSSDEAFHCLAITIFFWDSRVAAAVGAEPGSQHDSKGK